MIWTPQDIQQFTARHFSEAKATEELMVFRRGIPKIQLERAATLGDGIVSLKPREERMLVSYFEERQQQYSMVKFVPASGAATRMFKPLLAFLEASQLLDFSFATYLQEHPEVSEFIKEAHKFPFHSLLIDLLPAGFSLESASAVILYLKTLLELPGLGFGSKPKALLPFHQVKGQTILVLEEHIQEAFSYAVKDRVAHLHFTVSEQHLSGFKKAIGEIEAAGTFKSAGSFNITFSHQNPQTDTLVLSLDQQPIRDVANALVFHPAGHGALLENLAAQEADIIFIKNVDNVGGVFGLEESLYYKKVLGGKLLDVQEQLYAYAKALDEEVLEVEDIAFMCQYYQQTFSLELPEYFEEMLLEEQIIFLRETFNRPLRVCGMVANEGKVGGGPFWIKNAIGEVSLQIVEATQMALKDPQQQEIFENATHFNPVDLVCSFKNYKGEAFNLNEFKDPSLSLIAEKTRGGKRVKVLELPGLWNGSMAGWNTIFIAVPSASFTPVKTVTDLLDVGHLGQ